MAAHYKVVGLGQDVIQVSSFCGFFGRVNMLTGRNTLSIPVAGIWESRIEKVSTYRQRVQTEIKASGKEDDRTRQRRTGWKRNKSQHAWNLGPVGRIGTFYPSDTDWRYWSEQSAFFGYRRHWTPTNCMIRLTVMPDKLQTVSRPDP